jgi:hypothetical protein
MWPRWHPTVITATLYDVRDRPAIDLEMESQIPSEVRHSFHNQATRRGTPLRNNADGNCAHKSKNQKNLADETVSRFHGTDYTCDWFFASADASKNSPLFEIAGVLVRLDHIARFIVKCRCIADCIRLVIPQAGYCPNLNYNFGVSAEDCRFCTPLCTPVNIFQRI